MRRVIAVSILAALWVLPKAGNLPLGVAQEPVTSDAASLLRQAAAAIEAAPGVRCEVIVTAAARSTLVNSEQKAHYGKKVIVLDFWATWCPPCLQEIPVLHEIARGFNAQDVLFLLVNSGEEPEKVRRFVEKKQYGLSVLLDPQDTLSSEYVPDGAIPATILIGRDGRVQSAHSGFHPSLKAILRDDVRRMIAGEDLAGSATARRTGIPAGPDAITEKDFQRRFREHGRRLTVEAFRQVGKKDQPWSAAAGEYLDQYEKWTHGDNDAPSSTTLLEMGQRIEAQGCDDPLFLHWNSLLKLKLNQNEREKALMGLEQALAGYQNSGYGAYPIFEVARDLTVESSGNKERLALFRDQALEALAHSICAGEFREGEFSKPYRILYTEEEEFFEGNQWARLVDFLEREGNVPDEWFLLMFRGVAERRAAWDARGSGFADTVTPEGWEGFDAHMKPAREFLTKAWSLHPEYPEAATEMITITTAGYGGSDETDRLWFDRAVAAQADYPFAYYQMLLGLRPRWHGTHAQMEALGREALESGRYDLDLPLFYLFALREIAAEYPENAWRMVFRKPGVHENLERMFAGVLAEPSRAAEKYYFRTQRALTEAWCGNYERARDMLAEIGIEVDLSREYWLHKLTWPGMDWKMIHAELCAFTGPHAATLHKAEELNYSNRVEEAVELYRQVMDASREDSAIHDYLRERIALIMFQQTEDGLPYYPDGQNKLLWRAVIEAGNVVEFMVENGLDPDTEVWKGQTLLYRAVTEDKPDLIHFLLDHGANPNKATGSGGTPLMVAVRQKNLSLTDLLIKRGSDLNARTTSQNTALHMAIRLNADNVAIFLIDQGANIEIADENGMTPLLCAAFTERETVAQRLVDHGADINALTKDKTSVLTAATIHGEIELVRRLLQMGAHPDATNYTGNTALHYATQINHFEIAKLLLEHGCDRDVQNNNQLTPLHSAIQAKADEVVYLLISAGANLDIPRKDGWTPLTLAAHDKNMELARSLIEHGCDLNKKNAYDHTALHVAISDQADEIAFMLIDAGANLEAPAGDNWTPLLWAVFHQRPSVVKRLLEKGANIAASSTQGATVLSLSLGKNDMEMTSLLLESGADLDVLTGSGKTVLIDAVEDNKLEFVKLFLKHGANVNLTDKNGKTPLAIAEEKNLQDILLLLRNASQENP